MKLKILKMGYYTTINGKKYDGELLDLATELTAGAGDGRLSLADSKLLYEKVNDANSYTDVEKDTIAYIRKNFKWTEVGDEWFRNQIRMWAGTK